MNGPDTSPRDREIERFELYGDGRPPWPVQTGDGVWVRFSDFQAREAELEKEVERVRKHETETARAAVQRIEKLETLVAEARAEMAQVKALLLENRLAAAEQVVHRFLTATPCSDQGVNSEADSAELLKDGAGVDDGSGPETSIEERQQVEVVSAARVFADSVERDRREPDKLLCHLQTFRRALAPFPTQPEGEQR